MRRKGRGGDLAGQLSQFPLHFLIAGVGIDRRRQRRRMPGEALGQEKVPRRPIYVGDRRVAQAMKRIQPIEPRPLLPLPPGELNPAGIPTLQHAHWTLLPTLCPTFAGRNERLYAGHSRISRRRIMRHRRTLLLTVAALGLVGTYWIARAGSLEPPGPPAPTDRVSIFQSDMPLTITTSGSYVVRENLTGVTGQHGITIDTTGGPVDVTLDLNGFSVVGVAGSLDGITILGANLLRDVHIVNGTIRGFGGSGVASAVRGVRVSDVAAIDNVAWGFSLHHSVFVRCSAFRNGEGFQIPNSVATDCIARENNVDGFSGGGFTASGCVSVGNGRDGFGARAIVVRGCIAESNVESGFRLLDGSVATNSVARNNTLFGFECDSSVMDGNGTVGNTTAMTATSCVDVNNKFN